MNLFDAIAQNPIDIHPIQEAEFVARQVHADVLRLDAIHPVVSGNKLFKLKYYIKDAMQQGFDSVGSFGGYYSNHLVALAFAAKLVGLKSIGIIRGEKPAILSPTLQDCLEYGMDIQFVSRAAYDERNNILLQHAKVYWVDFGGYGKQGMLGAKDILHTVSDLSQYSHILCAVGSGTTMAGLIAASLPHQQIIGISSMKNNNTVEQEMKSVLPDHHHENFLLLHQYHFGGFAKHTPQLIAFMNTLYRKQQLPTDIVYTSKLLFAVYDLILNDFFDKGSRLLIIHSGGLQGNRSLPENSLIFS